MQLEQPLFTVATITYNSSKWVKQTIESVLNSSYTNFEYLISDDCSTDNTWDIIQEYKDPRIKAWRNEKNIGEYPNRNKVLKQARGSFIIYIDGDDILFKDALGRCQTYIEAFPDAKGIWGVYPVFFDFVALPYLFNPEQLTKLNYLSSYPVSIVGFAESFFSVEALKQIGGLDERFAIGDTYIKKLFCCHFQILLVTAGFAFWRKHDNQASKKVGLGYQQFIESYEIDQIVLSDVNNPLSDIDLLIARENLTIGTVKLLTSNTLLKGKIKVFFGLRRKLGLSLFDFLRLFKKGKYTYMASHVNDQHLVNEFHFRK
jgi:glycosyltransferase involved in cell wall biosynthesis